MAGDPHDHHTAADRHLILCFRFRLAPYSILEAGEPSLERLELRAHLLAGSLTSTGELVPCPEALPRDLVEELCGAVRAKG
jgi:hypothetical protein